MIGPYRDEGTGGRCVCGVLASLVEGIPVAAIVVVIHESDQSIPSWGDGLWCGAPDCSAVATSSAQEGNLVDWVGVCDVGTAVCAVKKSGGGCGTCVLPCRSSSCDELCGPPTGVEGELVSLSTYSDTGGVHLSSQKRRRLKTVGSAAQN